MPRETTEPQQLAALSPLAPARPESVEVPELPAVPPVPGAPPVAAALADAPSSSPPQLATEPTTPSTTKHDTARRRSGTANMSPVEARRKVLSSYLFVPREMTTPGSYFRASSRSSALPWPVPPPLREPRACSTSRRGCIASLNECAAGQ